VKRVGVDCVCLFSWEVGGSDLLVWSAIGLQTFAHFSVCHPFTNGVCCRATTVVWTRVGVQWM